jgi:hypothetical protein
MLKVARAALESLIGRWRGEPARAPEEDRTAHLEALLAEIRDFTGEQRSSVSRGLAMLWEAFVGRFGGLDGFIQADSAARAAYLQSLQSSVDKMNENEALKRSRYSVSPKLMSLYLDSLLRRDRAVVARELALAVATMIEDGEKLRARRTNAIGEAPSPPAVSAPR